MRGIGKSFVSHDYVTHSLDEYVRGYVHTQVVENYFSILKRGLTGVYQYCGKQHLNNDRAKLGIDDITRA
jgi:hypothetical protein